jgi:hypothetical protein
MGEFKFFIGYKKKSNFFYNPNNIMCSDIDIAYYLYSLNRALGLPNNNIVYEEF